ncbi:MAG: toprim domain-containing protein [Patescibacteria group bacterium]
MSPIDKLTELFERFPGIGPRQARRFVQYLLTSPQALRADLADTIKNLGADTSQCKKCFRWFVGKNSTCDICADTHRDASTLFVIEKDADIDNVEGSGYKGLYFVLGGTIPLASEEPGKYIRLRDLEKRVGEAGLKEIILGLSATTEGDHTRQILAEKLKDSPAKLSSLGRGLSTGSELEYADPETIAEALGNRH